MFKLSAVTAEDVLQCCNACVGPCLVPAACAGETGETSAAGRAHCSLLSARQGAAVLRAAVSGRGRSLTIDRGLQVVAPLSAGLQ